MPTKHVFIHNIKQSIEIPYPSLVCHHQSVLSYLETTQPQLPDQTIALLDIPFNSPTLTLLSVEVFICLHIHLQNHLYKKIASCSLPCQVGEEVDELLFEYLMSTPSFLDSRIEEACRKMGEDVRYSKKAILKIQKELGGCKERLTNTMTTSVTFTTSHE